MTSLWLDAGAGTLGALLDHVTLEEVSALWISHTHADHFSDLPVTYYALRHGECRRPPLPVLGPRGFVDRLRAFLSHTSEPTPLESVFELHELDGSFAGDVGELSLRACPARHGVPALALRVEHGGASLGYTGDGARCEEVLELVDAVDLLVCEAGYGTIPPAPGTDPVHLTAAEAGALACDARAGTLVLTHLDGGHPADCLRDARLAGATGAVVAYPGWTRRI